MERIIKELKIRIPPNVAFQLFINNLNDWWPKEYTWSKEKLKEIRIDSRENGFCTETGPNGFRCDWGTVREIIKNEKISFKWQIDPKRAPVPDPEKASDVKLQFTADGNSTSLILEHFNFDKHGDGCEDYRLAMDSEIGWEYILKCYKKYSEEQFRSGHVR